MLDHLLPIPIRYLHLGPTLLVEILKFLKVELCRPEKSSGRKISPIAGGELRRELDFFSFQTSSNLVPVGWVAFRRLGLFFC